MIEALKERLKAAAGDPAVLDTIKSELDCLSGPEARELKLRLANMRFTANRAVNPTSFKDILAKCGLVRPDARPLHQYQLDEHSFDKLRKFLRDKGRQGFASCSREIAALFVLWSAHWFQRKYRGGMRRWEDIGEALDIPFDGGDGRNLVREGLEVWRRPSVKGDQLQLWLRTLAVEGGFPCGILDEIDGWVHRYLLGIVASLLATESIDTDNAFLAAAKASDTIPQQAYRQDIFYALAADLAKAIANYRRLVDQSDRPRGVTVSEWLDVIEPGWREKLPILTGVAAATKLVNGLIEAATTSFSGDRAVGCDRLLQRRDNLWRPGIRLGLDGLAKGTLMQHLGGRMGRVRVHPAAVLARFTNGEIAQLEPPGKSDEEWRVRPSRGDPVVAGVPLETPVTVELRIDGKTVGQSLWPKGAAVRSDIAVFAGDLLGDTLGDELILIGVGSGHYKPKTVAIAIPKTWSMSCIDADALAECLKEPIEDGRVLWLVQGRVRVRSPENDTYRIVTNCDTSLTDELHLKGNSPNRLVCEEPGIEFFAGAPTIRVAEGARVREPQRHEIRWRHSGERSWRMLPLALGRIEVAWMDSKAEFVRDRRRLFILPAGADIDCRREADAMVYTPSGFAVSAIDITDRNLEIERGEKSAVVRFTRHVARRALITIRIGTGRPVDVSVPFALGAGIATWRGIRISGGKSTYNAAKISLAELAECVAFADGQHALVVRLLDRDRREIKGVSARWAYEDELPLRDIASEISSMMALFGNIDVSAELSLQDGSAYWQIHQFEMMLDTHFGQLTTTEGFAREEVVELFGRPIDAPWQEKHFTQWSFGERVQRRFPPLPDGLTGAWIVYGKRGEIVVSRPKIKIFTEKAEILEGLPLAAMISDVPLREAAIRHRFDLISEGNSDAENDVTWLVNLCAHLQGMPPATFDSLQILAQYPVVAARIALRATGASMREVLNISAGLPLAWFIIPVSAWKQAVAIERKNCIAPLLSIFDAVETEKMADRAIADIVDAITAIEPILTWPLIAATGAFPNHMPPRHPLVDAAQDHIRRYGDQVTENARQVSVFRQLFPDQMPSVFERFNAMHLEALDAPCAAALVAVRGNSVDFETIRRIKLYVRSDPIYFNEAFDARFIELGKLHRT